jgi:hypothetical protein
MKTRCGDGEVRETTKDTPELYESHYRLKKLKCPVLPKPRTSQLIVLRHSLLTTKEGNRGILSVRGSSTIMGIRLPTITTSAATGLARKLGLLVGFHTTSGERQSGIW